MTQRAIGSSAGPKPSVLFADDDPLLLAGLRSALRSRRRQWDMRFVETGDDALIAIRKRAPDVIVADLRMPGVDGATLLALARELCPGASRIVLSGHADLKLVARAAAVAHRILPKPCDANELAVVIARSIALQDVAAAIDLTPSAAGTSTLPSLPRVYAALSELVSSKQAGAADAARIVEQDVAIAAKVLQLANSAFFVRRSDVTNLSAAVAYLGVDVLRALVLQTEAFRAFAIESQIAGFDPEKVQEHCSRVARLASTLVDTRAQRDDAFSAGLLHDVGLLVLACENSGALQELLAISRERGESIACVERERLGATHAEIGAHLLALWGLPSAVTEAVRRHQCVAWAGQPWSLAGALYVANALVEEIEAERDADAPPALALDLGYLEAAGLAGRLADWRRSAAQVAAPAG